MKPENSARPKEQFSFEETNEAAQVLSVSRKIRTLDDLLNFAKVDRDLWEVERYTVNRWEVVMREPASTVGGAGKDALIVENENGGKHTLWTRASNQPLHEPLYQIKAWLKRRKVVEQARNIIQGMLAEFAKRAPRRARAAPGQAGGCLLEVSIFDLHLGKLCWAPEAGANYDIKISESAFTVALESLIQRTKGFAVARVLFPIGNDFFNVDNAARTTTAGTPQDEDVRWQKSFVVGRKLMLDAVNRLREIAPVDIVMVSGNHDRERIFYLGDSLSGWLSRTAGVTVDNGPALRKYYRFGKCLIGFTHGNEEKHKDLPLIMATESPKDWAETSFRELHLGHYHSKREIHFQPVVDKNGIRLRIIPSLCQADAWHKMKGYSGLRSAEAFLWEKTNGLVGSFSFNPP